MESATRVVPNAAMTEVLAQLWIKFLPEIEARLAVVEQAAAKLAAGSLGEDQRLAAHAAAHKLAGTLGTFGLHRGTELARQAEVLLAEPTSSDTEPESELESELESDLKSWTRELRKLIAAKTS